MCVCVYIFLCTYKEESPRPSVNETKEVNASPIIYCGSGHPGSKVREEGKGSRAGRSRRETGHLHRTCCPYVKVANDFFFKEKIHSPLCKVNNTLARSGKVNVFCPSVVFNVLMRSSFAMHFCL